MREAQQKWLDKNPEYHTDWRRKNKEQVNARVKAHRLANPEYWKAKNKKDKAARYAKILVENENYRARRSQAGTVTLSEWKDVLQQCASKCLCCSAVTDLTMDHIVPLSCGGSHSKENLQVLCRACNSSKGTKTVDYRGNHGGK